ncbi:MAG TPA: glycoside hydrolase family 2 TIM barrel-domain containing protein [Phycisphaerae bacterium]|nr:glycoside hydrolase family 2 TIM barrel-domain containing protein [Phycisphaerae bacterium]HRY70008.1 glycoside hydrolase family 2 TIM barrel-domain containing protein [Phycisphaerae bacterium]HSA27217.1 glycoside hydrolase family 2 TIM barrel-domain containing protein [Phycisphaerae bacterium]
MSALGRAGWFGLLALGIGYVGLPVLAYEGQRANSVLLNGKWEFAKGAGDEQAETTAGQQRLDWKPVTLPGPFMKWSQEAAHQTRFVWARRRFEITPAQAATLAVLRWNRIACGAEAFINGRKVGENEPTGPFQVLIRPGVLKAGENQVVLKIRGGAGVRKSRSGNALIPAGFGVGMPEVTDDVWIDFADGAYMKWVLAIPDLAGSRVKIRVTPAGLERLDDLNIAASVKPWPDRKVVGQGQAPARLVPDPDPLGGEHFYVEVPMPGFQPWAYEQCPLYIANVKLTMNGRLLDELNFRFGMREIGVKDRNYGLNGKNLWLRGSNLVFEWNWGDTITGHEKDYLVTEAREMSMNSFRTHTQPPPRLWCDVCDAHGTMILAEFPVLFNYQDYKFTPEEWEIWHRNCLLDAAGWMARLWNHPSVIMWVLSNESRNDDQWEEGPFQDFVNRLDPTRPTMRTGHTTRENFDLHPCGNVTETDEGHLQQSISSWFKEAGDRTTTVSEYMNDFGHPRTQWTGVDDRLANDLAVAQIGAEHTETMRRARVDAILPYMYAGWTRTRQAARVHENEKGNAVWKAGYAAPQSAAWHSSLSPVLASLDLFDASYLTGQQVTTDLHLINDSWHEAKIHVDLLLTKECPELIPEAKCFDQPVSRWSFDFVLKADSIEKTPVTWRLPEGEGNYWLTARTTGISGRPVLSQRFVRAIKPPVVPEAARQRTFVVLGGGDATRAFFDSRGLRTSERLEELSPGRDVVVIWNAAHLTNEIKHRAKALCAFAGSGGRVIVLSTSVWNWPELCEVTIRHEDRFSRVFPHNDVQHPMLAGIDPQWLVRWNGLPGTVGVGRVQGPAMARAQKILWAKDSETTITALVPAAEGEGRLLFTQLDLQSRLDRSKPSYDPVAERILLNLLGRF